MDGREEQKAWTMRLISGLDAAYTRLRRPESYTDDGRWRYEPYWRRNRAPYWCACGGEAQLVLGEQPGRVGAYAVGGRVSGPILHLDSVPEAPVFTLTGAGGCGSGVPWALAYLDPQRYQAMRSDRRWGRSDRAQRPCADPRISAVNIDIVVTPSVRDLLLADPVHAQGRVLCQETTTPPCECHWWSRTAGIARVTLLSYRYHRVGGWCPISHRAILHAVVCVQELYRAAAALATIHHDPRLRVREALLSRAKSDLADAREAFRQHAITARRGER